MGSDITTQSMGKNLDAVSKYPSSAFLASRNVKLLPNGTLRDQSLVYADHQTDGLKVHHYRVQTGKFYRPDGTVCSAVDEGSGILTTMDATGHVCRR